MIINGDFVEPATYEKIFKEGYNKAVLEIAQYVRLHKVFESNFRYYYVLFDSIHDYLAKQVKEI